MIPQTHAPEPGLAKVTAAILAGGLGTRLRPVLDDRQKVLAPVGQRPFLTYLLDKLSDSGVRRVVLCTGFKAGGLEDALRDRYGGMDLVHSREPAPLGTAGALRFALDNFGWDKVIEEIESTMEELAPTPGLGGP